MMRTTILPGALLLALGVQAADAGDCPRPVDFNADHVVNGADLGVLLASWGPCSAPCGADLNGDGIVDGGDIGILLGAWGAVPWVPFPDPFPMSMLPGPADLRGYDIFDADGDAVDDVVAVHVANSTLYALCQLNDGTAHFTTIQSWLLANTPTVSAVFGFEANGDSLPDLVVAGGSQLRVCINMGGGVFAPAMTPPAGPGYPFRTIDIDSDSRRELLLASGAAVTVARWVGADFQYSAPVTAAFTVLYASVGDVDGDGDQDVLVAGGATAPFGWQLLLNQGGILVAQPSQTLGTRPYGLVLIDEDSDGSLDVMTSRSGANGLSVFHGDGHGNFGAAESRGSNLISGMTAGDLNGDGRPDLFGLATTTAGSSLISAYNRGGSFERAIPNPTIGSGSPACVTPRIADLDGDCHGEALVGIGGGVAMLRERNDALLRPMGVDRVYEKILAAADLDGDGCSEILSTGSSSGILLVWGDCTSLQGEVVDDYLGFSPIGKVMLIDVDADGRLDIVIFGGGGNNTVRTVRNLGNRQFAAPISTPLSGSYLQAMPMRLNDDAYGDLLLFGNDLGTLKGRADGTLEAVTLDSATQLGTSDAALIDLDLDGDDDVLLATQQGQIRVWMNDNGTLTHAPSKDFGSWHPTSAIVAVDFDGDGDLDLVEFSKRLVSDYGLRVITWRNDGPFVGFRMEADADLPPGIGRVVAEDLDGDGRAELVSAEVNQTTIFSIDSNGNLHLVNRMPAPGNSNEGIAFGRFGRDTYKDIFVGGTSSSGSQLYESQIPSR